jgi:TLD
LVVKDSKDNVFGGFLSHSLRNHKTFYGTGECLVFSYWGEDLKVYQSSMENNYFIFSNETGFGMGSG